VIVNNWLLIVNHLLRQVGICKGSIGVLVKAALDRTFDTSLINTVRISLSS
jgi:hypothetical protein